MTSTNTGDQPSRALVDATGVGGWTVGSVVVVTESNASGPPPVDADPAIVAWLASSPAAWCSPPGCWPVGRERPGPKLSPRPTNSLTAAAIRFVRQSVASPSSAY